MDYSELKRLAEAATAGPWSNTLFADDCYEIESTNSEQVAEAYGENDAAYISAASPDVVLSMIAEIDRLRTQNQALVEALELAMDNLRPHGDNCFLHDEGEYNSCFCGKDGLVNHFQSLVEQSFIAQAEGGV